MDKNTTRQLIGFLDESQKNVLGYFLKDEQVFLTIHEQKIWVKILSKLPVLENEYLKIPFEEKFILGENNSLFPLGKVTPTRKLANLSWQPIAEFFKIDLPVSAEKGKIDDVYFVQLAQSNEKKQGNALLTSFEDWKNFVETQASIRFQNLRFSLSQHQEVLIIGNPLPSIQGKEYWLCENMLLPAGYEFKFPLLAKQIATKLSDNQNNRIVFFEDGTWVKIALVDFVKTTRSAVR